MPFSQSFCNIRSLCRYILPPQLLKSTKNVLVVKADAARQLVIRAIRAAHLSALELGRLCELLQNASFVLWAFSNAFEVEH